MKTLSAPSLLFAAGYLLFAIFISPALALPPAGETVDSCAIQQTGPPTTESPIVFYALYDSFTTTATGRGWVDVTATWNWGGQIVSADQNVSQMPFSRQGADYLEGNFQDSPHRQTNLFTLPSADFNQYTGRVIKLAPNLVTDQKRVTYVNAVLNTTPPLEEKTYKYTDIEGNGPEKTIVELVNEYGLPNPPPTEATQDEIDRWISTWGLYWAKIPLSTNDKSQGMLIPPSVNEPGGQTYACGFQRLTVPDNYRLTNIAGDLNEILVPADVRFSDPSAKAPQKTSLISQSTPTCSEVFSQVTTAKSVKANKRTTATLTQSSRPATEKSLEGLCLAQANHSAAPAVLAAEITSCNQERPPDWEEGQGNQICLNNWLGTTVVRTFTETKRVWIDPVECWSCPLDDPATEEDESKTQCTREECDGTISVKFEHQEDVGFKTMLPYLEQIWNKSTYSQSKKPGFFSFFTPSVDNQVLVAKHEYEQHAGTPILFQFVDTTDDKVGTLTPQGEEGLFPKYMAGFNNAQEFVQNATWPAGLTATGPRTCSTASCPTGGSQNSSYNTVCNPDCLSPTRTCWDTSCEQNPPDCNDPATYGAYESPDDYCASLKTGGCGPSQTCTVFRVCEAGGNCVTRCEDCR